MATSFLTISLLLLATCISCVKLQTVNEVWRLPYTILPTTYRLHINVTQAALTEASNEYQGMVIIDFRPTANTTTIRLHAAHDHIRLNLITLGSVDINETDYSINTVTDILTINTPSQLTLNLTYRLIIEFTGLLSTTDMFGFYKSYYVNDAGVTRYLATTQFQPTSARRAFPCFDEPFFKATFEIYITYPLGYNALSNTPGTLHLNDSVSETVRFEPTALMSTYLIAFVISDFTCSSGASIGTVPYQVCSRVGTENIRQWALDIGPPLLQSLNNYTQFDYGRSKTKLDQVAIPDFAAGAMENWGLVTYREVYLLWDPNESTNSLKQFIATINSHEFGHFWFGNLVTCKWWSETFLNEGFATYFEYFTTHSVLPSWELDKQFVIDLIHTVLVNDALEHALPLQSEANTPTEVMAKFGRISYSKGGAIFRMVEHVMGSTNFRNGLINYLDEYQYRTTEPEDLWVTMQRQVDNETAQLPANLVDIMYNWVLHPGFPLLTVAVHGTHIDIRQERFLLSGDDTTSRWYVPVSFTTSEDANKFENTAPNVWLTPTANASFNINVTNATWFIINNQQTGYFRVNYDTSGWNNIRNALLRPNFDGITDINRAQIVDDLFNLARSDRILYAQVFSVVQFLANDTSYFSWVPAIRGFNFLLDRVGLDSQLGQAIAQHVLDLMENLYQNVSFTNHDEDDQIHTLKQVLTLSTACRLGKSACIASSEVFFFIYKLAGVRPVKNLRSVVYCNALRHSTDQSDWEFLWNVYRTTTLASELVTIIPALGCTQDKELLERYLNLSITENSGIRSQDRLSVFTSVYNGNPVGVEVAFDFLTRNHERINEMYLTINALPNLINGLAGVFTTEEQVESLEKFINDGGLPQEYLPSATTALETARANIEWVEYFHEHLFDFFLTQENQGGGAAEIISLHVCALLLFALIGRLF